MDLQASWTPHDVNTLAFCLKKNPNKTKPQQTNKKTSLAKQNHICQYLTGGVFLQGNKHVSDADRDFQVLLHLQLLL